ncbi:MAG: aspartate--tRNA ligase [Sulfobacillus acidophilus]|uniref:Aspartate--tRNA(Asp/Asn) ligase n=1 Tax=Sulfobacillus acidophilus TaxID=53633 RepID=A0A2T2WPE0_9FIRM|nr:MAG: aspartate--tRNA ligase [Sulfobacillus acidophilus]
MISSGRTHYAAEVNDTMIGQQVRLAGWVHHRRDHGGLIFIDLRDRTGLIQIVCEPDNAGFDVAYRVRSEYVLGVTGVVRARPEGMVNAELASGQVEVVPSEVILYATAKTPPFNVTDAKLVDETLRLKYRYLDLRRPELTANLILRDRSLMAIRQFFHRHGFLDVETPALARSTPEGARDFLVPTRIKPGHFYALPQSPQIFKQLLMVGGLDRYYQIAKVFRDEDLRADRQPEFTQIDVEMSFVDQEQVLDLMESMLHDLFKAVLGERLERFERMTWHDAMRLYGSDKPDLRSGPPLCTLTDVARTLDWPVLREAQAVVGFTLRNYRPSRRELDQWGQQARELGANGLLWLVHETDGLRTSASKFLSSQDLARLADAAGSEPGDAVLIVAGQGWHPYEVAGQLRLSFARQAGRVEPGWRFLWVTEFPLFEWSEEEGRFVSAHHPFTRPVSEDEVLLESNPAQVRSQAYDVVLNGIELASGSLRIYQPELQARVFDVLGLSRDEAQAKFGFLLEAFQYGAPPHGGIAFGLDRLLMLMAGADSIRDVIAFPKTARGTDPLMDAPSTVDPSQLRDVHLEIRK